MLINFIFFLLGGGGAGPPHQGTENYFKVLIGRDTDF
jgi:hypothetical protein